RPSQRARAAAPDLRRRRLADARGVRRRFRHRQRRHSGSRSDGRGGDGMNAVLVDDERLARAELRRLLRAHADVAVVGEASNVDEAVALVNRGQVDVIFLDIQMPDGSGFDVLARLDRVPAVIFTTAYDRHALHAFEVNALDYLMKPIAPERLASAIARAARTVARPAPARLDRVFVRDGERCWLVAIDDIRLFEAE